MAAKVLVLFLAIYMTANESLGRVVRSAPGSKEENSELPPPPPNDLPAAFARYIVHFTDWGTLSYNNASGHPVSRVYSFSDGKHEESTGIPYIYVTKFDPAIKILLDVDNKTSFTISMAQTNYCKDKNLNPEDPRCPQVTLTGRLALVDEAKNSEEFKQAKDALFERHPVMKDWPTDHGWVIVKLDIEKVHLVNGKTNGGHSQYPEVSEYLGVTMPHSIPTKPLPTSA